MASWQSRLINFLMRQNLRTMDKLNIRVWNEHTSVQAWRDYCENGASKAKLLPGVEVIPVNIPGLPSGLAAEWLQPTQPISADAVIFYTHGGGYLSGSCSDHRALVSGLVAASGLRLLLFEYRIAPEHPFPAALDDAILAYRWLLTQIAPSTRVIIAGESAGGGLCLATLLALKDLSAQGDPLKLPVIGVSISPTTDMKLTGKPNLVKGSVEPVNMRYWCSKYYVGENDPAHPYISPLYGDLCGLPPLLLTVGDAEENLDDSVRFAERAKAAGVDVRLIIGEGQMHCYPLFPGFIPESKYAMDEIRNFIHQHI